MAYLSVAYAHPITKKGVPPKVTDFLLELEKSPETISTFLSDIDPVDFTEHNILGFQVQSLSHVQARLFLDPNLLFNKKIVSVKDYFGNKIDEVAYRKALKEQVKKDLISWIKSGAELPFEDLKYSHSN
jgi:hypothetical protein